MHDGKPFHGNRHQDVSCFEVRKRPAKPRHADYVPGMGFLLHGVDPAQFSSWFALSDLELAARGAVRRVADERPGYPCRVSLVDADVGDELLLVPFQHHETTSPYRASGPIFVRRDARAPVTIDRVPDVLARRQLSIRAYDAHGMMAVADLVDGRELAAHLDGVLDRRDVAYVHVHYAKPGCYACRVTRHADGTSVTR